MPRYPRSSGNRSRSSGHILAACHHTRCGFRWDIVRGTGSECALTFDFLARQLLQAVVMRLRFRTGASDMAVAAEMGEAGRVGLG